MNSPGGRCGEAASARILVVEDSDPVRVMVLRILEDEGYHLQGVRGATAALERCAEGDVDLLISDVRLAGANGVDIARAALELDPRTKVLLMSAEPLRPGELPQGLTDANFLLKPFRIDDLLLRVRSILGLPD